MQWFAYAFITLGLFLLLLIPALIYIIRNHPIGVVRPIWQDQVTPEFAAAFGIILTVIAFISGVLLIVFGFRLL